LAGSIPVAGNLFHHAVELYLKGDLRASLSRDDLKRRYRHHLRRLWKAFKAEHASAGLDVHDATIAALHKFEAIRYPDAITDRGMSAISTVRRPSTKSGRLATGGAAGVPYYELVLEDVDRLVAAIFDAARLNPDFLFPFIAPRFLPLLYRHNKGFRRARRINPGRKRRR
jgi:hypothetical protein